MGRPKLELDAVLIEKLASIHCTMEEIAYICKCSVDTLENRFSDTIKEAKAKGKSSLRRHQWEAAQKGNTTMMIWLGKQLLDQRDVSRIELTEVSEEQFTREVERRLKLVGSS